MVDELEKVLDLACQFDLATKYGLKPVLIERDVKKEGKYGIINYIKGNYEAYVCKIEANSIGNMFGYFLDNGKRVLPNWYKNIVELCEENKGIKCLMVFDGLDKTSKDAIKLFIDEVIFNHHDLYPLPTNVQVVCTVKDRYNIVDPKDSFKDINAAKELFKKFTIVNDTEEVVIDNSDIVTRRDFK